MRAIQVKSPGKLSLIDTARPTPEPGQVVVKVRCAPINPSDRMLIEGTYVEARELPFIPGIVGVGTVVGAQGCGLKGRFLLNKRVVFSPGPDLPGTWAEYAVALPDHCLPLPADIADTDGINLIANAMTALALVEKARAAGTRAVLLTGASGEVARMFNRMAGKLSVINIVRSQAQKALLETCGAQHVLVSTERPFDADLKGKARKLQARMAFDCVAGPLTSQLMHAMPDGSEIVVYGRLSGEPLNFDGLEQLVGRGHVISGFNINTWLQSRSLPRILLAARMAAGLFRQGFHTEVAHRLSLEELVQRYDSLEANQSRGKSVVFPTVSNPT